MNNNIKIARQLIRMAKELTAAQVNPEMVFNFDEKENAWSLYANIYINDMLKLSTDLSATINEVSKCIGDAWTGIAGLFPETAAGLSPTIVRNDEINTLTVIRPLHFLGSSRDSLKLKLDLEQVEVEDFKNTLFSNGFVIKQDIK